MSKGTEDAIGNKVRVKIVKNKVAPPFRKVELEIIFGKGISALASLLDGALQYDIISKSGSWYSYGEERIGQGRENAKLFLENNTDIAVKIEKQVRALLFPDTVKETDKNSEKENSTKQSTEKSTAGKEMLFLFF